MKKLQERGVAALEIILIVVIIGLIGGVGWWVYKQNSKLESDNSSTVQQNTDKSAEQFTTCPTEVDKIRETTADTGLALFEWKTIEHRKVVLSDWNLSLTIPQELVGKAVCRRASNAYEFSTKAVVEDLKCVTHFRTQEISSEGLQIWQYPQTTLAEGQFSNASGTLEDYYKAHKAQNGNYMTDPEGERSYYKLGDNFYVAVSDTKTNFEQHKAARTAACKNEKPDFTQPFAEAMKSLSLR